MNQVIYLYEYLRCKMFKARIRIENEFNFKFSTVYSFDRLSAKQTAALTIATSLREMRRSFQIGCIQLCQRLSY